MEKLPICAVPSCIRDGFMFVAGEIICGKCYMKYNDKMKKEKWEMIKDAS